MPFHINHSHLSPKMNYKWGNSLKNLAWISILALENNFIFNSPFHFSGAFLLSFPWPWCPDCFLSVTDWCCPFSCSRSSCSRPCPCCSWASWSKPQLPGTSSSQNILYCFPFPALKLVFISVSSQPLPGNSRDLFLLGITKCLLEYQIECWNSLGIAMKYFKYVSLSGHEPALLFK